MVTPQVEEQIKGVKSVVLFGIEVIKVKNYRCITS
jgi:hypothetical protein